jgi:hypothetical protein
MISGFMGILIIAWLLLSVAPVQLSRRNGRITWWDYLSPFLGIVAWFGLSMAGVGSIASLSNFAVECFWIIIVSVVVPWCRWGLSFKKEKVFQNVSFALSFVPILLAVILRLTVPSLPE